MDVMESSPESGLPLWAGQRSYRVAVGLFALHFLWAASSWSQRSSYFFAPCAEYPVELDVRDLAVSPSVSGRPAEIALLSAARSFLLLVRMDATGSIVRTDTCPVPDGQRQVVCADLEGKGRNDIVTFNGEKGEVTIVRSSPAGFTEQTVAVPPARHLMVADINSDGRPDLLLYGKTTAGVMTFLNRRDGRFVRGPILFPDVSAADLQVCDLDGDGVNDVFLLDWLSNKLDVFYGISRLVFSEQLSVDIPGEPSDLAVGPVTSQRTTRVAITVPTSKKILVYDGNAVGDFDLVATLECPSPPQGVAVTDIDKDGLVEVVSSTDRGLLVRSGTPLTPQERTQFFAPGSAALWALSDLDGDGYTDLVALDRRNRQLHVLYNDHHQPPAGRVQTYAVGVDPVGVTLGDIDSDGLRDVLVANEGSNTVSRLLNRGDGRLRAQQSIFAGEAPTEAVRLDRGGAELVVAHSNSGRVRIVSLQGERRYSSFVTMTEGEHPEILDASFNRHERRIEIMIRSHDPTGRGTTLTFLEQLSRRQFLERTFRPTVAVPVLAATARHEGPAGGLAVLFATNDPATARTTVYAVQATPAFIFGAVSTLFSFPDSLSRTFLLTWEDEEGVYSPRAVVAIGEPTNALGIFSMAADTLAGPVRWVKGVRPIDDAAVKYEDVDGDGIADLVVADAVRGTVSFLRGTADGRFGDPWPIAPAVSIGGFAVGSVVSRHACDLLVSDRRAGVLRIFVDPFRRVME
jgi:hypothetical protein